MSSGCARDRARRCCRAGSLDIRHGREPIAVAGTVRAMDVGIGLPSTIPGAGRDQLLEWARRAEARGFSTLGTIDRIVYPSHDPLIALAAAAAVTERIRLATTILLAPTRANGALLAKQAATLDALSDGRLVLGVSVGRREDDYQACGVDFHARGRIFDEMLELCARIWDGEEFGTAGGSARGRPTAAPPSSSAASPTPRSGAPRATATAGPRQLHAGRARRRDRAPAGRVGRRRTRRRAADDGAAVLRPRRRCGAGGRALPGRLLRIRGDVHGDDRGAGRDRCRDGARERPGVRRGGVRRADLLPVRPGSGSGRPARRRAAGDRVRHVSEPARPGGVRQRRCDRARRRVRRPARRPGRAGRLRRPAGRRRAARSPRRWSGAATPSRSTSTATCATWRPCRTRSPSPASGSDR